MIFVDPTVEAASDGSIRAKIIPSEEAFAKFGKT